MEKEEDNRQHEAQNVVFLHFIYFSLSGKHVEKLNGKECRERKTKTMSEKRNRHIKIEKQNRNKKKKVKVLDGEDGNDDILFRLLLLFLLFFYIYISLFKPSPCLLHGYFSFSMDFSFFLKLFLSFLFHSVSSFCAHFVHGLLRESAQRDNNDDELVRWYSFKMSRKKNTVVA